MTYTVVLIGNGTIACRGLRLFLSDALKGKITVPMVVTEKDDSGEDSKQTLADGKSPFRESLLKAALACGYVKDETVFCANPNTKAMRERIAALKPHVIISLQCRSILKDALVGIPTFGTLNLHNAPLPLLRGCDPFAWAVHDGLLQFGVSLHRVPMAGVDDGPVFKQRLWAINEKTTAWNIFHDSLREGEQLLAESFYDVIDGKHPEVAQDPRYVSYHPMGQFNYKQLEADWSMVSTTLSANLRARIFPAFQCPFSKTSNGTKFGILACYSVRGKSTPGVVTKVEGDALWVGAKWGSLVIDQVIVDNVNMTGAAFADKEGLQAGEHL